MEGGQWQKGGMAAVRGTEYGRQSMARDKVTVRGNEDSRVEHGCSLTTQL